MKEIFFGFRVEVVLIVVGINDGIVYDFKVKVLGKYIGFVGLFLIIDDL